MASTNETVNKIVKILDGKKGRDIEVLNISELTTMTDYFIIKKDIRRRSGFFWRMMKL